MPLFLNLKSLKFCSFTKLLTRVANQSTPSRSPPTSQEPRCTGSSLQRTTILVSRRTMNFPVIFYYFSILNLPQNDNWTGEIISCFVGFGASFEWEEEEGKVRREPILPILRRSSQEKVRDTCFSAKLLSNLAHSSAKLLSLSTHVLLRKVIIKFNSLLRKVIILLIPTGNNWIPRVSPIRNLPPPLR